jgi:hypothetical protein
LRVARVDGEAGRNEKALPLYEEAARIFAELTEKAPDFDAWHSERKMVEEERDRCRERLEATFEGYEADNDS